MIRYVEKKNAEGVVDIIIDRERGMAAIPVDPENRDYKEYLEWVAGGNTVVGPKPSVDHILVEDNWVLSTTMVDAREKAEALANIKNRDIQLFKMILAIWDVLKDKGLVANTDLPVELRTEAANWKQYLDRVEQTTTTTV